MFVIAWIWGIYLLDKSWWHVPFHELVFCGLYSLLSHLENTNEETLDMHNVKKPDI